MILLLNSLSIMYERHKKLCYVLELITIIMCYIEAEKVQDMIIIDNKNLNKKLKFPSTNDMVGKVSEDTK